MGSFEAVEDQVEAELVLVAIVVTGLQHVPERELGEVGILPGGEARQHDLRERGALLGGVERQPPLLQREPVDVAVQGGVGVRGKFGEKPASRRQPRTASWCRSVAGPGEVRDSIRPIAHRCRARTARTDIARWRMALFQPPAADGSSISANTRSIMPSRRSSLLVTWLYSDIASTPTAWASLRIDSVSMPFWSAKAAAARRTRSRLRGMRGAGRASGVAGTAGSCSARRVGGAAGRQLDRLTVYV